MSYLHQLPPFTQSNFCWNRVPSLAPIVSFHSTVKEYLNHGMQNCARVPEPWNAELCKSTWTTECKTVQEYLNHGMQTPQKMTRNTWDNDAVKWSHTPISHPTLVGVRDKSVKTRLHQVSSMGLHICKKVRMYALSANYNNKNKVDCQRSEKEGEKKGRRRRPKHTTKL